MLSISALNLICTRLAPMDHVGFARAVQQAVGERYDGNKAAAARAWKMPQSGLQQLLDGTSKPGLRTLRRLAPHLPLIIQEYLGIPGGGRSTLPQLDAAVAALSATLSGRTRAYADSLRRHWVVDQSFGVWAGLLYEFERAHGNSSPPPESNSR